MLCQTFLSSCFLGDSFALLVFIQTKSNIPKMLTGKVCNVGFSRYDVLSSVCSSICQLIRSLLGCQERLWICSILCSASTHQSASLRNRRSIVNGFVTFPTCHHPCSQLTRTVTRCGLSNVVVRWHRSTPPMVASITVNENKWIHYAHYNRQRTEIMLGLQSGASVDLWTIRNDKATRRFNELSRQRQCLLHISDCVHSLRSASCHNWHR